MLPTVSITKADGATGSVSPSPVGILAIIAPAAGGPFNSPAAYTNARQMLVDFSGPSELVEDASYVLATAGHPIIAIRPTTATAAAYGTIDITRWTGTSVPTAGAAVPADNYDVIITAVTSGTIGIAGITYTYSLDGGGSTSGIIALGVATTLTIPNFTAGGSPGVSFALAAGTVVAGDFFRVITTHAKMTDADLAASLEAIRVNSTPWEAVYIDEDISATTVGVVDTWLAALEKAGKFRMAFMNTRFKNQLHLGSGIFETEAQFATAMGTLVASSATSIRISVGTDGGEISSTITGLSQARKAALFEAARSMAIQIGVEPAYVALGPLGGVTITDESGNPEFHNEEVYPNLDQLQLMTLRSVQGQSGSYVTNGRIFSTAGSDYQFVPHVRTMNRGCELAFQVLTVQLSRGIGKKPKDPITGLVYIAEGDALSLEALVNGALIAPLNNQVVASKFTLSRTDDLSPNSGAILTGTLNLVAFAYIKGFVVTASFAKSIAVPA